MTITDLIRRNILTQIKRDGIPCQCQNCFIVIERMYHDGFIDVNTDKTRYVLKRAGRDFLYGRTTGTG